MRIPMLLQRLHVMCIGAALGLPAAQSHGAPPVKLQGAVGDAGLSSLALDGHELMKYEAPLAHKVTLETTHLDPKLRYEFEDADVRGVKVVRDAAGDAITQQYEWGSISYRYEIKADRVNIGIGIRNDSRKTIAEFHLIPLRLELPQPMEKFGSRKRRQAESVSMPGEPGYITARFGDYQLVACGTRTMPLTIKADGQRGGERLQLAVIGGQCITEPGGVRYYPLGLPRIEAGKNLEIDLSVRFARVGDDLQPLVADVIKAFRAYHQPRLEWKDRRPIGAIFLQSGKGPENNPRFWFKRKDLDVRTQDGRAQLHKLFMDLADRSIRQLKQVDAQGAIIWNAEGSENPHPITYIGDPRMIPILAPEVDDILPDFCKKFTDAGLRIGFCLRPTQVYQKDDGEWHHGTGSHMPDRNPLKDDFDALRPEGLPWHWFFPVAERLSRKIEYAKRRFGATLFYVDTNGVWRPKGEKLEFKWTLLDSHIWRDIHKKHPDVLLVPEFSKELGQLAYTSVYRQTGYGPTITPEAVRRALPDAFAVCYTVNVHPSDWYARRDTFLKGVMQGDSMFFRAWFGDHYNRRIKELYEEAAIRTREPVEVCATCPTRRLQALRDADEARRYYGALAVAEARDKAAVPLLLKMLQEDDNWLVRRAAGQALGRIGGDQAVKALSALLNDPRSELHYYAGEFLSHIGVQAIPMFEAVLTDEAERMTWESVARGVVRIDDAAAFPLMKRIMDEEARAARWSRNIIMSALAESRPPRMFEDVLGRIGTGSKNWDAELAYTLGAYGDRRAIGALIGILERETGTREADGRRAANAARRALEKITGLGEPGSGQPGGGRDADRWRQLLNEKQ